MKRKVKSGHGTTREGNVAPGFYEAVYALVCEIPKGRVMTYGQIAAILGSPRAARAVGYAMGASGRYEDVPWQRVINHKGGISARGEVERPDLQMKLLQVEGVIFNENDQCNLKQYRWEPADPEDFFFETSRDLPF